MSNIGNKSDDFVDRDRLALAGSMFSAAVLRLDPAEETSRIAGVVRDQVLSLIHI